MSQPFLSLANVHPQAATHRNRLREATISLTGTVPQPISSGTLGVDRLLRGNNALYIIAKITFDVRYERLDEKALQTVINEWFATLNADVLPFCKHVRRLRVSLDFKCSNFRVHELSNSPEACSRRTNLKPGQVERTAAALRVGILNTLVLTKLHPRNFKVKISGDHFPVLEN